MRQSRERDMPQLLRRLRITAALLGVMVCAASFVLAQQFAMTQPGLPPAMWVRHVMWSDGIAQPVFFAWLMALLWVWRPGQEDYAQAATGGCAEEPLPDILGAHGSDEECPALKKTPAAFIDY